MKSNNEKKNADNKNNNLWDLTLKILTICYSHGLEFDASFPLKIN